jgi:hypothetical protein
MARTLANIRADIQRLETMLRSGNVKRRTPLRHALRSEIEHLRQVEKERVEARTARRAERHTELDENEALITTVREETDLSPYLRNKLDDWGVILVRKRKEIDE